MSIFFLVALCGHAWADDGSDLLKNTDSSFWATLNGTGKKYIYGIELIIALATYMKSKNLLALTGVVVIALFFNIVITIAGAPSS